MRALFLALVVANVVFFGWAHWIDVPQGVGSAAQGGAVPTLALAHAPTSALAPTRDRRCRSLGPFPDPASAQAAAVMLQARRIEAHDRASDSTVSDGYWVYISDVSDSAAQRNVLTRLQRGGIDGSLVIGSAEPRVSVGIFSQQARAVRLAEQVRALGLKPILDLHQRVVRSYWLDMDLRPDQPEPPVAALQSAGVAAGGGAARLAISFGDCPASDKRG